MVLDMVLIRLWFLSYARIFGDCFGNNNFDSAAKTVADALKIDVLMPHQKEL